MLNSPVIPPGMDLAVEVYTGDYPLATAMCALWPADHPTRGAVTLPHNQNWLSITNLRLLTADGTQYSILPKREEHAAGRLPVLVFDIG